jgi:hypothetical protein
VLSADLIYSGKGVRQDNVYLTNSRLININYLSDYLSLPLKIGVNVGLTWYGQFKIGVVPSFRLNSKIEYENNGIAYRLKPMKNAFFDFGIIAEARVGYWFDCNIRFYLSIHYNHSFLYSYYHFTPVHYQEPMNTKFKHTSFSAFLGIQVPVDLSKLEFKKRMKKEIKEVDDYIR